MQNIKLQKKRFHTIIIKKKVYPQPNFHSQNKWSAYLQMLQRLWSEQAGLGWPRMSRGGTFPQPPPKSEHLFAHTYFAYALFIPFQRRDSRCLHPAGSTNTTSQQLLRTTTAVTTTTQQRASSQAFGRASTPLKTPAATNHSAQTRTNRRTAATPQPATSKPAGGEINKLFSNTSRLKPHRFNMCVRCFHYCTCFLIIFFILYLHPSDGAFYDAAKNFQRIPENYIRLNIMYESPLSTAAW